MIGIFLALQVNNYNVNRNAYNRSKVCLEEFVKDLKEDSELIGNGLSSCNEFIHNVTWALTRTDYSIDLVDSLWLALGGHFIFYPISDRTFQKVQNSRDTRLIGFDYIS